MKRHPARSGTRNRAPWLRVLALMLALACALRTGSGALGAVPTLTGISPAGVQSGTTATVKFGGKLDGSDRRVWCSDPRLVFTPPDAGGVSTLSVPSDTPPGTRWVRTVNAEGASPPVRFVVSPFPRVDEKEPNDEATAGQLVTRIPAWIHGQLDKAGDVDGFTLELKKGVPLWIRVDGYALGSGVDLLMHVLNPRGERVLTASDSRSLDPCAVFYPEEDGRHTIQLAGFIHPPAADVGFTGAAGKSYQIHLSSGPVVTRVFPAAVARGARATLAVAGPGVKAGTRAEVGATPLAGDPDRAEVSPRDAPVPIEVVHARHPVTAVDAGGVDSPASLTPPCVIGSRLKEAQKEAAFRVSMKKGERLQARFWSRSLGLGVEGNMSVYGPSGTRIAANANPSDVFSEPTLVWTATAEGDYVLRVGDLFGRCTEESEFVLEVAAPELEAAITLPEIKPLRVEPGKSVSIKAKVTVPSGWKTPLVLKVNGLPDGVSAAEVTVPEKGGDVDIPIQAAVNAPLSTAAAWVSLWTRSEKPLWIGAAYPTRGDTRRGHSSTDFGRDIWVTAGPALPPEPPAKAK